MVSPLEVKDIIKARKALDDFNITYPFYVHIDNVIYMYEEDGTVSIKNDKGEYEVINTGR